MGMILYTTPGSTSSVSSEMLFIAFENVKANNPVTYPNYKYVLDIYVDSVLVARQKVNPDPTNHLGVFNVAPILQGYVPSYGLDASSSAVDYTPILTYQVKVGEEYSDTVYTNLLTDSSRTCFRTYKPRPFTSSGFLTTGIASNMPSTVYAFRPHVYHLIPYFSSSAVVSNLSVKGYDKTDSLLFTDTVSNASFTANRIRQFDLATGTVFSNNNTSYLTLSGPFNLRIEYICSKYTPIVLAWLNPFGAYESQHFGLVSKKTIEISKRDFSRLPYNINVSGTVSYQGNNVFYGGRRQYAANTATKMKITSHLLNENEYTWLADLFKSPDVYVYDPTTTYFVPCRITETSYEYRNFKNSRAVPLEFEVEFSDQYNSQFL